MNPRRVFLNSPPEVKPRVVVSVILDSSCGCHHGQSGGARVTGTWSGDVPAGHSHCDIMALASVVNAECFLAVSALVDCMVAGGMTHDEAWDEIKRGSAEYLARRVDG
jgi:hypothetical protein